MAPAQSTKELIAGFGAQEMEFYKWHQAQPWNDPTKFIDSDERWQTTTRKWGHLLTQYLAWAARWYEVANAVLDVKTTEAEFYDAIKNTNFADPDARGEWHWMMEMGYRPFIVIGQSSYGGLSTGYALATGPALLTPNREHPDEEKQFEELDTCIMGINTNVNVEFTGPKAATAGTSHYKRRSQGSVDMERLARPDDIGAGSTNGFVFAQLGELYHYQGDRPWEKAHRLGRAAIEEGPWEPTGFGVVAELDSRGKSKGIWVIYNFFEEDEETGKRVHCEMTDGKGNLPRHIGRPHVQCRDKDTFTLAKIAPSIEALRANVDFNFEPMRKVECQLVRAKSITIDSGNHTDTFLIRQFVKAGPARPHGHGTIQPSPLKPIHVTSTPTRPPVIPGSLSAVKLLNMTTPRDMKRPEQDDI